MFFILIKTKLLYDYGVTSFFKSADTMLVFMGLHIHYPYFDFAKVGITGDRSKLILKSSTKTPKLSPYRPILGCYIDK